MTKQKNFKFIYSASNAKLFGYNTGMTQNGIIFSYTTVINIDDNSHRSAYEIEGETVYIGTTEDLIAIKVYHGTESQYIKNITKQSDPFSEFNK